MGIIHHSYPPKNSEILREQMSTEDNDIKALALSTKIIREERSERFEDIWLERLQKKCNVIHDSDKGKYTFEFDKYGIIDFYPKSNNLLIRKLNKWHKPGLNWIIKNFELDK